jgi:predicted permease
MGVDVSELLVPFAGAIQASFSVLLTIAFGVVAAQCNLLSTNAAKEVSKLCVRMFLPALLIYKIGSNLHQETGVRYIPVLSMRHFIKVTIMPTILTMLSLVDILYASLRPPWTRPHSCL